MLKQTYQNWELLIHDDGSTDGTFNIAMEYANKDSRIKVSSDQHRGCPYARNRCLKRVTGVMIGRQDADDTQDPTRIQKQVAYLLNNPRHAIVTTRLKWLTGGSITKKRAGAMDRARYLAGKGGSPVCASIVAWRSVYERVGGFDETMLAGSDGDWNFRALAKGYTFGFIDEYLYTQRRHPAQISQAMRGAQHRNHETSRARNRTR
jgi:glycosyltransferase EpsE